MSARSFHLAATALLISHSASSQEDLEDLTELDVAADSASIFMEAPAKEGSSIYCEYEVRDVHLGKNWAPLVAIMLDEVEDSEEGGKYLQLDMTYVLDDEGSISHNFLTSGFDNNVDDVFLLHWDDAEWYTLEFIWEGDGVFRYSAALADNVVAAGKFVERDFDPKYFRVTVSGMQLGMFCEVEK